MKHIVSKAEEIYLLKEKKQMEDNKENIPFTNEDILMELLENARSYAKENNVEEIPEEVFKLARKL